jgi:hypothetical protein
MVMTDILNNRNIAASSLLLLALILSVVGSGASAQQADGASSWSTGTQVAPRQNAPSTFGTTTVLPDRSLGAPGNGQFGHVTLEAFLSTESKTTGKPPIDRGLVWRVFTFASANEPAKLIATRREAVPSMKLPAGKYAVNAAFGRAHLTQVVDVVNGRRQKESFILNAGGLRVVVKVAGELMGSGKAHYDVYSDERDQSGNRHRIMLNAKPGLITRLNSGLYHIVSRFGDANAQVSADVAVEAGKLTEAVVSHEAAKVTFKLVQSKAGEALADTQWIIMTKTGDIIKETAGALPTHVLAPGTYSVSARWSGKLFSRTFDVKSGDNVEVEVLMR